MMMKDFFNLWHFLDMSPWPIINSFNLFSFMINSIFFINSKINLIILLWCFFLFVFSVIFWLRDITRESTIMMFHTNKVKKLMKKGTIMFITSELMLFFSLFWTWFWNDLSPDIHIGSMWPPMGIEPLNPWGIPLLNTMLLLMSGITLSLSHLNIEIGNKELAEYQLFLTTVLGWTFIYFQYIEYFDCPFSMSDGIYGSIFFLATGFHGGHVIFGNIWLMVNLYRLIFNHFSMNQQLGLELAAWYWHFVDVVWLFLYTFFYWINF